MDHEVESGGAVIEAPVFETPVNGSRILLLDPNTVNQIAAGEVVERPSSVVKELVENAIDAGAMRIVVRLEAHGTGLIEVADDGHGMTSEEAKMALLRHATSKIRSVLDLQKVATLGFRGEAVPSIASVSRFTLSTGVVDGERTKIRVNGGVEVEVTSESGPKGTTIRVEDLFFNTPARLKFLKSPATELGQVVDVVAKCALSHPGIAFKLSHGNQVMLDTLGTGDLAETLAAIWGRDVVRALAPLEHFQNGVRVRGFVSGPAFTKPTRSQQWFFVNGRPVRHKGLMAAIDATFRQLTPDKRFPVAAILLDLDPSRVDMNVSPTKSECRFVSEGLVFEAVRAAMREALLRSGMMPSVDDLARANEALKATQAQNPLLEALGRWGGGYGSAGSAGGAVGGFEAGGAFAGGISGVHGEFGNAVISPGDGAKPDSGSPMWAGEPRLDGAVLDRLAGDFDPAGLGSVGDAEHTPAHESLSGRGYLMGGDGPVAYDKIPAHWVFAERFLRGLRIIGQTQDCFFIIAENAEGLMIVDQHVAHERIMFERLRASRGQVAVERQPLLVPVTLELDRRQSELLNERLDEIGAIGYRLEAFGPTSFLVREVPAASRAKDPIKLLRDMIDEMLDGAGLSGLTPREQVWVMAACKMSIKAGEPLGVDEMEKLLRDLAFTENPYLCPHGRPVTLQLSTQELLRRFKR